jgi:hypothetical protein
VISDLIDPKTKRDLGLLQIGSVTSRAGRAAGDLAAGGEFQDADLGDAVELRVGACGFQVDDGQGAFQGDVLEHDASGQMGSPLEGFRQILAWNPWILRQTS